MDPVKILKRSWHILWNYRTLWVFGLILALTVAGSAGGSGNSGSQYNFDGGDQTQLSNEMQDAFNEAGEELEEVFEEGLPALGISDGEITALIWIGALFILVMLVLGVLGAIARYVSETALIHMVDEYEESDTKITAREGWRIGWSRTSWRLFLINLIVNIPAFILFAVLIVAGFMVYAMVGGRDESFAVAGMIGLIGVVFLVIFVVAIVSTVLNLLRRFFWRTAVLEDLGVRDSLHRGFAMVRANWKEVGIMWLVMVGLGVAWVIVSFISLILLIPIAFFTVIIGAVIAAIPGMLLVGFFSLFLNGALPWIIGGIFILPLFLTIAFFPWVVLSAGQLLFTSIVWTLTYREINAMALLTPELEPELDIEPTIE
ncbi:MAG: hypothetical protein HN392_01065 [Anaerolineae bacterium]|jgi:hypothetical protein|nr:hypothetical protein [Anaerolineae bacterium]MBT7075790.1 hypothetical protein [Anaerolineae bacterium]MBT7781740.1 hypothetical protein [Anaerolineae bacterium]